MKKKNKKKQQKRENSSETVKKKANKMKMTAKVEAGEAKAIAKGREKL